ncbi:hypothetical protein Tco_0517167 [Tanacetum coccineum]
MEKEVAKLKKDPLHTQVTALVDDHLDTRLGATRDEFMNFLSALLIARITEQVKNQLLQILPEEVSNFTPRWSKRWFKKFELKKILIDKIDKSKSYLAAPEHKECYEVLKKSYDLDKTIFSTYDSDMPKDQKENLGKDDEEPKENVASKRPAFRLLKGTRSSYAELEYDFEECYKALSEKLDWENPKVEVMRKHGYGYLKEIVLRRPDNDLYRFKEGDFPCLRINDIEDMLLLVVQNQLINLSGDDVSVFAISLRMFTRSLVIQKRVEDL